ncbi:hypothetical protein CJD36_019835 [Flavipsychrobacter stenotrophus]|uniref:Late control protein n=1 Tax=Flavipsychrobacter stenotrophus TaxID=2077091 RepID=A0A2S7SRF7_9BACT|nr:hypothetical protein [Flavipsychrobacter stenotrophus]PQJ09493.1 hypothetical protein CJD36_019835 [Flavipsychrobacter stenotrophus]
MFVLSSKITIGGFSFSGVMNARINRSVHSAADACNLMLPSLARVKRKNGGTSAVETLSNVFAEGDKIKVELGYNGQLKTEFEGFVKGLMPGDQLTIECEGYNRLLRLNKNLKGFYASTSVKELLDKAVKGTEIELYVQDDIALKNITLDNAGGTDIISEIRKICQNVITIFFITPKKLWCGLTYTAYHEGVDPFAIGGVKYRIGYNCMRDNRLKIKTPSEPVQVLFGGTLATGRRIATESEKKVLGNKVKAINNNIPDVANMKRIANEMQYQKNYTGFEGRISGYLQPYCQPGYKMYIQDSRYPESAGFYMAESTEVTFGTSGAWRNVEVGPKMSFKS